MQKKMGSYHAPSLLLFTKLEDSTKKDFKTPQLLLNGIIGMKKDPLTLCLFLFDEIFTITMGMLYAKHAPFLF